MWFAWLGCVHRPAVEVVPPTAVEPAPEVVVEEVPDLVDVQVPREFRGLWVATVVNLDFPSRTGLTPDEARAELSSLVDVAAARGINALVFQVRPESDALYASALEPWSRFLTGTQGVDPGFDPLAALIERAHARAIEVHAWFNPYRAQVEYGASTADSHVTHWAKGRVCHWGTTAWCDPSAPEIQERALAVITDVVTRYDIDGVHLDDYFYPYPVPRKSFPDAASYAAYQATGGSLSRADWRRNNVDVLVEQIADRVAEVRPTARFGISPFGIYRPGQPPGIHGMDQVDALFADPLKWYREGWVDYLAPQLYWSSQREAQRYDLLLGWWDAQVLPERPLYVGLDLTKVGKDPEWTLDEVRKQITLSREVGHTQGQILFRAAPLLADQGGVGGLLGELYARPALPPPVRRGTEVVAPPEVTVDGDGLALGYGGPEVLRAYVVYRAVSGPDDLQVERILPPGTTRVALEPGTWAVSAVVAGSRESAGVRLTIGG